MRKERQRSRTRTKKQGGFTMMRFWTKKIGNQRGFTLIELMIVVAKIGRASGRERAQISEVDVSLKKKKAQADARALASAISIYSAHMGNVAAALTDLTVVAT